MKRKLCIVTFLWMNLAAQSTLGLVSAADYSSPVAAGSIVSLFADNIATGTFLAVNPPPAPLPLTLGGVHVDAKDATGNAFSVPLLAVTSNQANAVLPAGMAAGTATFTITTGSGNRIGGDALVVAVAPSVFTADQSGRWLPAAQVIIAHANGSQTVIASVAVCGSTLAWNGFTWSKCVPSPINLGSASDTVVLELFGTGIRGSASLLSACPNCGYDAVDVAVGPLGSQCCHYLPVLYAGPQGNGAPGSFYGLDQVNVVLPHDLSGSGLLPLTIVALSGFAGKGVGMGSDSNTVYVYIQ